MSQHPPDSSSNLELDYPFKKGFHPQPGEPLEVADGVYWLRMSLPMAPLDHINLWLLHDGDGWAIVDTGYDHPLCTGIWDRVFAEFCSPDSINRIIVTHYHPDHIGLAAWLAHRCKCQITITRGELDRYRKLIDSAGKDTADLERFIDRLGFNQRQREKYLGFFIIDEKPAESRVQVRDCEIIQHDDQLQIGGRHWRVVMGNGHSPEHACLYCEDLKLLISGDQILPRISSNISVYQNTELEDPLADWLSSCARLRDTLPADALVLPAHQEPFYGLDRRLQFLLDEHHGQLDNLRAGLAETSAVTAVEAHRFLFDRELTEIELMLATGETLAHLNYLWHRGEVQRMQQSKVVTYRNSQTG